MSAPVRRLVQPGPPRAERWIAAAGPARTLDFTLAPGLSINEAVARPLIAAGIRGATVEMEGGALGPFTYVMPALSADPRFAAYYSESHRPEGRTAIERAVATFGERDGEPFIHCHGTWREEGGRRGGGHVMPLETIVREPIRARAFGTSTAAFAVLPDAETNFSLFTPVAGAGEVGREPRTFLLKLQPNEALEPAIEAACRMHGIAAARVRGIGSIVGAHFADGRHAASIATELFLDAGDVRMPPDGPAEITIDITLVDVDGVIHAGRLAPGNRVCITCELSLTEI